MQSLIWHKFISNNEDNEDRKKEDSLKPCIDEKYWKKIENSIEKCLQPGRKVLLKACDSTRTRLVYQTCALPRHELTAGGQEPRCPALPAARQSTPVSGSPSVRTWCTHEDSPCALKGSCTPILRLETDAWN